MACSCSRLNNCCCCASLQTGSVITGVLGIILSIVNIVLIWVFPVRFSMSLNDEKNENGEDSDWLGISNTTMKIILTVNLVMTIIISTLMIVGALKHRSWYMLPWIVLGLLLSIGLLVSVLHTSIKLFLMNDPNPDRQHEYNIAGSIILVGGLIYIPVFLYLWWVVLSHFLNVKDEEDRGRYMKPPYRR